MPDELHSDDEQDEDDEQQPAPKTVTLERSHIRTLEKKAKRADEADARATAAERRLAFIEAGIDTKDPLTKYFIEGYKGELTEEAIKTEAIAAGFLTAPAEDEKADAELAAHDRVAAAANGGGQAPAAKSHPWETLREAKTPEEFWAKADELGVTT